MFGKAAAAGAPSPRLVSICVDPRCAAASLRQCFLKQYMGSTASSKQWHIMAEDVGLIHGPAFAAAMREDNRRAHECYFLDISEHSIIIAVPSGGAPPVPQSYWNSTKIYIAGSVSDTTRLSPTGYVSPGRSVALPDSLADSLLRTGFAGLPPGFGIRTCWWVTILWTLRAKRAKHPAPIEAQHITRAAHLD